MLIRLLKTLPFILGILLATSTLTAQPYQRVDPRVVARTSMTAGDVNGTWRNGKNRLSVHIDEDGSLRVLSYRGTASDLVYYGNAFMDGMEATIPASPANPECIVTLTLRKGRLIVARIGSCAEAPLPVAGTYKRVSRDYEDVRPVMSRPAPDK